MGRGGSQRSYAIPCPMGFPDTRCRTPDTRYRPVHSPIRSISGPIACPDPRVPSGRDRDPNMASGHADLQRVS